MARPTRTSLEAEIRFHLEQLSVRNAHHEFETLCRRHARARVCDRVLPATGPVADGGDQGRDFETFKSFKAPDGLQVFFGSDLPGDKHLVFACTAQKEGLSSKIKADVKSILKGAVKPDHIYYYAVQDLSVSRRHKLQDWAVKNHQVGLDIFDGQAISTELADPSLFWIAVEHLGLSVARAPVPLDAREEWYAEERARWEDDQEVALTTANYLRMRLAARHFIDVEDARQDLSIWLEALDRFAQQEEQPDLAREARYERIVLNIRGKHSLVGLEDAIDSYRQDVLTSGSTRDLEHLGVVLSYVYGAIPRGAVDLQDDTVLQWRTAYREEILRRLESNELPNPEVAALREALASSHLLVLNEEDRSTAADAAIVEWNRVVDVATSTPLFPVERLAGRLTVLTPALATSAGFRQLTERVDGIVAKRAGDATAAGHARDRGMALFQAEMHFEAVDYLHRAKSLWFAGETRRGTLLSMLMLAMCYQRLGCGVASKYYAMGAAMLAASDETRSSLDVLPRAVAFAAVSDFNEGWWLSHFGLAHLFFNAHAQYVVEPGNLDRHETLVWIIATCGGLAAWAQAKNEAVSEHVRNALDGHPVGELIDDVVEEFRHEEGPPKIGPSDIYDERCWSWSGLGVEWRLTWKNDRHTTAVAEALAAMLQLVLVDLAAADLEVVQTVVQVRVTASPSPEGIFEGEGDDRWRINLVPTDHSSPEISEALASSVIRMISDVALTPDLLKHLEDRFAAGLPEKTLAVRSYCHLFLELVSEESFGRNVRAFIQPGPTASEARADVHPSLRRREGLSPRYADHDIEQMLRNRYEAATNSTRLTLPRLARDEGFRRVIHDLRAEGWLGWQILAAISVTTASQWLIRHYGRVWPVPPEGRERCLAMTHEPEQEDLGFPPATYDAETLERQLESNMMSSLTTFGLKLNERRVSDIKAVRELLRERFRYFDDDLPELDPLRALGL